MKSMESNDRKIKIVVDRFVTDGAQLVINTLRPGKLPLEFDVESLKMTSIGPDAPMHFEANLTNPKPVGNILSSGSFGPWLVDRPRDTPVSGTYSFGNADLGTIKGIGGILSSTGTYAGTLDNIVVDGTTDTPDFRIAISGRPVPLHTDFHTIVDGTSGDTYLQPVKGRILDSSLVANGSVVRVQDPRGHPVELDVVIEKGEIDDLLRLVIRTDPPIITGGVQLKTKLDLPPGEPDVSNRLRLAGRFQVSWDHFLFTIAVPGSRHSSESHRHVQFGWESIRFSWQSTPGRETLAHGNGLEVDTAETGRSIFQQAWRRNRTTGQGHGHEIGASFRLGFRPQGRRQERQGGSGKLGVHRRALIGCRETPRSRRGFHQSCGGTERYVSHLTEELVRQDRASLSDAVGAL